jgi:hypothetical protein
MVTVSLPQANNTPIDMVTLQLLARRVLSPIRAFTFANEYANVQLRINCIVLPGVSALGPVLDTNFHWQNGPCSPARCRRSTVCALPACSQSRLAGRGRGRHHWEGAGGFKVPATRLTVVRRR